MSVVTVPAGVTSRPHFVPAGSIVKVSPAAGASAVVEYTSASPVGIANGVANWAPWPKGPVSAAASDLVFNAASIRVTALGGTVDLDIQVNPGADRLASFRSDWAGAALPADLFRKLRNAMANGGAPAYNGTPTAVSLSMSITPVAVTANTTTEQQFTITGLQAGDIIGAVSEGGAQTTGIKIAGFRMVNTTTIALDLQNITAGSLTPFAGTYNVTVARMMNYGIGFPFVTVSASGAGSSISPQALYKPDSNVFKYAGTMAWNTQYGGGVTYMNTNHVNYSASSKSGAAFSIEFMTNAPKIELFLVGNNRPLRILVDGQIVTACPVLMPGSFRSGYRVLIDFTQGGTVAAGSPFYRKLRRIRIDGHGLFFGGVIVNKTDSIYAPTTNFRSMSFGDSFTEAPATANDWILGPNVWVPFNGLAPQIGYLMGWEEHWISGVGGTGYLSRSGGNTLYNFQDRIHDIIDYAPDVVTVMGSVNDPSHANNYTPAQLQAAVTNFYQQLTSALPSTLFFVFGVQYPSSVWDTAYRGRFASGQPLVEMNNAVKAGCQGFPNVYFIDMIGGQWVTGSGNAGTPTADGNADVVTRADLTHPTDAGNELYARRATNEMRAIIKANS